VSDYAGAPRERLLQLNTADLVAAPANGAAPHMIVSPRTSRGLPTSGIGLVLLPIPPANGHDYGTPATALVPGFTVTLYRALPTAAGGWAAFTAKTGVPFLTQLTLPDISGAMALWFQITNVDTAGILLVGLAELD
jgi:hypothetical protein